MLDIKQIKNAIKIIAKEKNIQEEKLLDIIEQAIKTAYKKDYGHRDEEVNMKIDLENETLEASIEKTVVKVVENPALEISLDDLGEDGEGFNEGDMIELDVTEEIQQGTSGESFGRIASQAARQVIIQRIGDTEKEKIYELFEGKEGEVINLKIEIVEGNKVIFDYNGNQVVLPKSEQVSRDNYVAGARFHLYVKEVSKSETGAPKVILTRKSPKLVAEIFAESVPEIEEGVIKIDNIVRHPGVKTKLLVSSTFDEIDPVGTLIGQKGMRVKAVMDEISGEKIDIVPNSGDFREIVKKSLSPAEVLKVEIEETEEGEVAIAYIKASDRARAVGKGGLNVNLASKLLDCKISIVDLEEEKTEEK